MKKKRNKFPFFSDKDLIRKDNKITDDNMEIKFTPKIVTEDFYKQNIPLDCKGKRCVYKSSCPLLKEGKEKEGEKCPVEKEMIEMLFQRFKKDLNVDDDNIANLLLIRDLVDIEIKIMRAHAKFASEGDFERSVTYKNDVKYEMSNHVSFLSNILKEKTRILEMLVATPERAAELAISKKLDPSSFFSMIKEKRYNELPPDIEIQGLKISFKENPASLAKYEQSHD